MSDQAGNIITLEVAARLLMIGPERIRQLAKAGYLTFPKRGHVDLVGAVQGYIRFLKDEERRTSKSAADSRVRDARAAEIELKIAERKRELIPFEDATMAMAYLCGKVRGAVQSIPARVTRDLPIRRLVEAEVNGALDQIAKALEKSIDAARTGVDPAEEGAD